MKKSDVIASICFLAAALIACRDLLATPGVVGHMWDWDIPATTAQLLQQISRFGIVWDYQLRGGFYSPNRPEGLYWLLTLPLAFLGGEVFSKSIIVILLFIAGTCMRQLASRVLGLDLFWSTLAGLLYMLSPVAYSRLSAGHMHMLSPYAVMPLVFLFTWRALHTAGKRVDWRQAVAAGLVLGYQGVHPSFLFMSLLIVALVAAFSLLALGIRRVWVQSIAVIGVVFGLVVLYWALPVGIGYLTTGTLYHSGWPTQQPDLVTASSVMIQREETFRNAAQPVTEALRQNSTTGIHVEFTYPVPQPLQPLWLFASFLLPICAFAALLTGRRNPALVALAILALVGVTVIAGSWILTGAVLAQWLLVYAFPVWGEFGNTVRAMPLTAFAYAALGPVFLQWAYARLAPAAGRTLQVAALGAVVVYTSPFLSGYKLIDPGEPYALKSYQSSPEDTALYRFLQSDPEGYRVTYVGPPWFINPEYYDLGYEWFGGLSSKPEFLRPYYNPEPWASVSNFRSDLADGLPGKLLGLAGVKYVVYPRERYKDPSGRILPAEAQKYTGAALALDRVLATQPNLTPVTTPLTETAILRNDDYVPRIYTAPSGTLFQGDGNNLADAAVSSYSGNRPALFFTEQQPAGTLEQLQTRASTLVIEPRKGQSALSAVKLPTTYLYSFPPLAEPTATLRLAQPSTAVVRVHGAPFERMAPLSSDATTHQFEPALDNGEVTWTSNVPYIDDWHGSPALETQVYLDGSSRDDEFARAERHVDIDLREQPYLHILSRVDRPDLEAVRVEFGLDFDGDGAQDATASTAALAHGPFQADDINALDLAQREFPDKPHYRVVTVAVRFGKRSFAVWEAPNQAQGLYGYAVPEIGFGAHVGTMDNRIEMRGSERVSQVTWLTRAVDASDVGRYPVWIEYKVDGPGTIYTTFYLVVRDAHGALESIPLGSRLLEPFEDKAIPLDVREWLPAGEDGTTRGWTAVRVEAAVQHMQNGPELRPTTLTLAQVGSAWDARGTTSATPALKVDGKSIPLKPIGPGSTDLWYTTDAVVLPVGIYTVSTGFADPRYSVDSIEVAPVAQSANTQPPQVRFEQINSTRYRAHVENASAPFFLVFGDSFNADWHAYVERASVSSWYTPSAVLSALLDSGERTEVAEHYRSNGFSNAWFMDRTGTFDVVIEFTPQRMFEAGLVVSLATFFGCLAWFLLDVLGRAFRRSP